MTMNPLPLEFLESEPPVSSGKPKSKKRKAIVSGQSSAAQAINEEYETTYAPVEEPNIEVGFQGSFGKFTSWYHKVIQLSKVIVLIYDKGYKFGGRYTPPDSLEPFIISYKLYGQDEQYWVGSIGIQFDIEVDGSKYEITVLPRTYDKSKKEKAEQELENPDAISGQFEPGFSMI